MFVWSEVTNPMQIMFSVLRGMRPDTSLDSLPLEIPSRETLISLMTCGWTANPDERPSFLSEFTQSPPIQKIELFCCGLTSSTLREVISLYVE